MENPGIKWGIYLGIASVIWTLISYLIGAKFMLSTGGYIAFVLYLIAMVMSARETKDDLGGFASFSEVFKPSFVTFAIGTLIALIFSYILMNFVDPSLIDAQREVAYEATKKALERFGAGEEQMEEALLAIETDNPVSIGKMALGYVFYMIPGAIVSSIIALFTKKNNPAEI